MSALRFLFLTLLLAVDSVLSAEGQTINKTAEAGQDSVTLPCAHGKEKIHMILLEWTKPGLDPDIVFMYRDGRFESDRQHPSFQNRVDLQDRQMKDGDASLILKNVRMNDTGTYECRVQTHSDSVPELISSIHLEVSPPPGTQEGRGKEARGDKEGGDEEGGAKEGGAKEGGDKEGGAKEGGDKEGGAKEGGDEEGASSSSRGLIIGIPVSFLCVLVVGVAALIYFRKPACLQRLWLRFRRPPLEQETPKPAEPEQPEPDETEISLLSPPSEPPDAGPSSTSGTQTAASSPEHPAHPE